jgi:hypothetical protein
MGENNDETNITQKLYKNYRERSWAFCCMLDV